MDGSPNLVEGLAGHSNDEEYHKYQAVLHINTPSALYIHTTHCFDYVIIFKPQDRVHFAAAEFSIKVVV